MHLLKKTIEFWDIDKELIFVVSEGRGGGVGEFIIRQQNIWNISMPQFKNFAIINFGST